MQCDGKLEWSLISEQAAKRTNAQAFELKEAVKLRDGAGQPHNCTKKISLTWRPLDRRSSQVEEFYLVNSLPDGLDALLRKNIEPLAQSSGPIYTLENKIQTEGKLSA